MQDNIYSKLVEKLHNAQNLNNKEEEIIILYELGKYHYNNENFNKSEFTFKQILKKNSKAKYVNYYLGLIKIQLGDEENAIKFLKREIKVNKNHKESNILLDKLSIKQRFPIITIALFIINTIFFTLTFPEITFEYLFKFGAYQDHTSFLNLFTSLFFHINTIHYITNMVFLLMFGILLEKYVGSLKFLSIYIISGTIGTFIQILITPENFVIGASSALFGLAGATIMRAPLLNLKIFGFINSPIILVFGCFFILTSFFGEFLKMINLASGDIAHFFGMVFGMFITAILYPKTIENFYHWLFIYGGFWLFSYAFKSQLINQNIEIMNILIFLSLIVIAIFFIYYSYELLKKTKGELLE